MTPANGSQARLSTAELACLAGTGAVALLVVLPYLADAAGVGLAPIPSAIAAVAVAAGVLAALRRRTSAAGWRDLAVVAAIAAAVLAYLCWPLWPGLVPPGSGSDLAHHLLLVDYLERHGTLVHEPGAAAALGEMADYTPGFHVLAYVAGRLAGINPFFAVYPVVALSVALKFAVLALVVLRLLDGQPGRFAAALFAAAAAACEWNFSFGSFLADSFLAQAVAELFAVAAWWAVMWWTDAPSRAAMLIAGVMCAAVFLTWPVWLGPVALALAIAVLSAPRLDLPTKLVHVGIAGAPVLLVIALHIAGRTGWLSILGTSGAVPPPSSVALGWWLPVLAMVGFVRLARDRRARPAAVLIAALALQAAALWLIARGRGAATPYMAIKMIYLALYPAAAAAAVAVAWFARAAAVRAPHSTRASVTAAVVWAAAIATAPAVRALPRPSAMVVSSDLFAAGQWARAHVPPDCVDYLVGNSYTAYWLHLAVLGNPRASARSGNDDTYATQASMARWLVPGPPRYAIANLAVLPAEIRRDVDILTQFGGAAVIARRGRSACE